MHRLPKPRRRVRFPYTALSRELRLNTTRNNVARMNFRRALALPTERSKWHVSVHRGPRRRTAIVYEPEKKGNGQQDCETKESKSVYRCGGKEKHMCFNLISRGKSGQHRAPQRLTAVRQQCLVPATETRRYHIQRDEVPCTKERSIKRVKRAHCGLQFQVNR